MSKITVVVDNNSACGLAVEHGLALLIDTATAGRFLLDTGSGQALLPNLSALGISPATLGRVIISHGHDDHTGGLAALAAVVPELEVYYGAGMTRRRFSRHPDRPVRELTMPAADRAALAGVTGRHEITAFNEIAPGVYLTGPIPRISGEDCGGPFFLDRDGKEPDGLSDEQAVLLGDGTLIHGCCHSGIMNTLAYCQRCAPQIRVTAIMGGLHLLHARPERLRQTAACLRDLKLRQLVLLHCTGDNAIAYLRENVPCPVYAAQSGETYAF